jgi:hypothetical protein
VSRLPIIPDGTLLLEQPESVAFEHTHQLAEPQGFVDPSPVYRETSAWR